MAFMEVTRPEDTCDDWQSKDMSEAKAKTGMAAFDEGLPFANQADLHTRGTVVVREKIRWDDEGYERTQRRNGACQCPQCGLWWPNIEEPDMWTYNEQTGKWDASGWWGGVVCGGCQLLMIEQPDGQAEVYDLGR